LTAGGQRVSVSCQIYLSFDVRKEYLAVYQGRHVGFLEGLRYRGKEGMLAWVLHRITGLGILFFVGFHVVAAFFLNAIGDQISTAITTVYESAPVQVFVYFCVLYHALNGLRLVVEDFWPALLRYHRELLWFQWLVFLPVFGLPAFLMITNYLSGGGI
jgi:succinate dehydrogenase / fumarate reductase cytochrome b subunit